MDTMATKEATESHTHTHTHHHHHAHPEPHQHGSADHANEQAHEHSFSHANKHHFDDLEAERMDDERSSANVMGKLMAKVRRYNLRADWQGLAPEEMHAICADLEQSPDALSGEHFDVIVVSPPFFLRPISADDIQCSAAYHHFESIDSITRTLASYLKPGGALLVTDITQNADNTEVVSHPHANIVAHKSGFSPAEIKAVFTAAGLVDVVVNPEAITNIGIHGHDVTIFLAKGVKPSS
ncbi:hypothetical protein HWV62_24826 [Athelia sp. TMB]|nr:hypothetical protein HWV62_24826 [Athelia sp. TMB]